MEELINKYIKEDNREKLLELAFEEQNNIDLNSIADYYIKVRDSFNICELISMVSEYLDLDNIFDKIVKTKDKKFMFWIVNNNTIKSVIDEKYISKLEKVIIVS